MEADFTQYYQADLRDLWRGEGCCPHCGHSQGKKITLRWVIVHLLELPDDSRIKKHYIGDKGIFSINDHLVADLRDLLLQIQYLTMVNAMKDFKQSQQQKILRGAPKRLPRPGDPEPEKPKMASKEDLKALFPDKVTERRKKRLRG